MSLGITSATLNQNSQQPVFMSSQRPHFSLLRAANMSQFCFVFFLATTSCGNKTHTQSLLAAFFCYCCFVSCMQVFFVATLCSYIKDFFLASLLMVFTIRFFAINLNFLELTQCSLSQAYKRNIIFLLYATLCHLIDLYRSQFSFSMCHLPHHILEFFIKIFSFFFFNKHFAH